MRFTKPMLIMNPCNDTKMTRSRKRLMYRDSEIPKSSIKKIRQEFSNQRGEPDNNLCEVIPHNEISDLFSAKVIRAGHARRYLGMCKTEFSRSIKPYLTAIKIGTQGVGYEREDLDAAWEAYKKNNIKTLPSIQPQEHSECRKNRVVTTLTPNQKNSSLTKSLETSEFDTLLSTAKARRNMSKGN